MKEAVIVVDMVYDFVYGILQTDRAQKIIPPIQSLIKAARESENEVVFVGDAHLPTDPELEVFGEHAMKGTPESETIKELQPQEGDHVLEKRTYSAFFETGLDLLLRRLNVDSIVITGLHTHICCRHTAADAFHKGYGLTIASDCVEALTDEDHNSGLEYIKTIYNAKSLTSGEIIESWATGSKVKV